MKRLKRVLCPNILAHFSEYIVHVLGIPLLTKIVSMSRIYSDTGFRIGLSTRSALLSTPSVLFLVTYQTLL
ncbi:hypothetical protein B0H11DRAFT_1996876 [Mycena galericulata]|nr:hypothetical protein B0H11DRAFT_1996876 [Mycena galericulata]